MKTGNVSLNGRPSAQAKPIRQNRTTDKREPAKISTEKVDLSTKGTPVTATPIASYEEALQLIRDIDFRQFEGVEWISQNGKAQLMQSLQA